MHVRNARRSTGDVQVAERSPAESRLWRAVLDDSGNEVSWSVHADGHSRDTRATDLHKETMKKSSNLDLKFSAHFLEFDELWYNYTIDGIAPISDHW